MSEAEAGRWRAPMLRGDKSNMPGMVRLSFGCYNKREDIDRLVAMLHRIQQGDYQGDYRLQPATGEYVPADYVEPLAGCFSL